MTIEALNTKMQAAENALLALDTRDGGPRKEETRLANEAARAIVKVAKEAIACATTALAKVDEKVSEYDALDEFQSLSGVIKAKYYTLYSSSVANRNDALKKACLAAFQASQALNKYFYKHPLKRKIQFANEAISAAEKAIAPAAAAAAAPAPAFEASAAPAPAPAFEASAAPAPAPAFEASAAASAAAAAAAPAPAPAPAFEASAAASAAAAPALEAAAASRSQKALMMRKVALGFGVVTACVFAIAVVATVFAVWPAILGIAGAASIAMIVAIAGYAGEALLLLITIALVRQAKKLA